MTRTVEDERLSSASNQDDVMVDDGKEEARSDGPVKKKARPSLLSSSSSGDNNDGNNEDDRINNVQKGTSSRNNSNANSTKITTNTKQQSSLFSFFSSKRKEEKLQEPATDRKDVTEKENISASALPNGRDSGKDGDTINNTTTNNNDSQSLDPIIPTLVPTPPSVTYESLHGNHVIIRRPGKLMNKKNNTTPTTTTSQPHEGMTKIAGFDMDGTLLQWVTNSPGFWPNQLTHYEVWNTSVITKLRSLYDNDGYVLVIFTNQGGIQSAHSGKKATLVKTLLDYLEHTIGRPLYGVVSTKSPKKSPQNSYHKPKPDMWTRIVQGGTLFGCCDRPPLLDTSNSFFVGDSADDDDDQGGVDLKFATNVGLQFYTPEEYFGPSNQELRSRANQLGGNDDSRSGLLPPPPPEALEARSALLGGYLKGPLLLILAGVQGSGKSTFCKQLLSSCGTGGTTRMGSNNNTDVDKDERGGSKNNPIQIDGTPEQKNRRGRSRRWIHLSQDTINNGKPGKREAVEAEARRALQEGNSVVIDRMHLDVEQRKYFVDLAHDVGVPVHIVLLNPPKRVISHRVKNRVDHPAKVQGESGTRLALQSMDRLVVPSYDEKVQLITFASTSFASTQLALRYGVCVRSSNDRRIDRRLLSSRIALTVTAATSNTKPHNKDEANTVTSKLSMPVLTLGTMKMGRSTCSSTVTAMITAGFEAIDTAPTYKNEDKVGIALQECSNQEEDIFVIAKVPKRAVQVEDVKSEFENTLRNLQRSGVDLLLLHWPSDVIAAKTLPDVWKCMEGFCKEGKCKALGVCNFNQPALAELLRFCTIPPVVNQIERHPLLSQMDLVDFCGRHNIAIQAHTPLGQGKIDAEGGGLLSNPVVQRVATESGLSPAQVLLQWNLQQGVCVVPKCSQQDHAKEILELLELQHHSSTDGTTLLQLLSPDQMKALDGLDSGTRYVVAPFMYGRASYCWGERMPSSTRR